MSEIFKRLVRRAKILTIVKSSLIALSVGAFCSGILLFLTTHNIIPLPSYFSFIIGASLLAISFVLSYLLLRKSERDIARSIDGQYSLSERVRTMLEYRDFEGAIYELQRDDTEQMLSGVKLSSFGTRRLWIYITAAALSLAMLVTSVLLIPRSEPQKTPADSPFSLTKLQLVAMEELISYVEGSNMQEPYKDNVALSLRDLLASLKLAETMAERDSALKTAVDKIYSETDSSSSAVEIIDALYKFGSPEVKTLAYAVNHYSWQRGKEWESFTERMTALREVFVHSDSLSDSPNEEKMTSETKINLASVSDSISLSLARSQISSDDIFYVALLSFAERSGDDTLAYGLGALAESDFNYTALQNQLDRSFISFNLELSNAIEVLSDNITVGEYAMTRLSQLFNYSIPKLKRPENQGSSSSDGSEGGDGSGGGGGAIGSGTEFGSDDLVLDPFTGEYVEYGEIFNKYYTIMFNKLQGDYYTDEEKAALEKYFDILYGGFH